MNVIYDSFIDELLTGAIDLATADIRAILVKDTHTPDAADDFLSDIVAGDRIGSAVALTGKTVSGGVFDAADVTFTAPAAGSTCAAVVLYVHTGTEATSQLIAYLDAIDGLPLETNGADITVAWSNGARKILKLVV